MPSQHRILWMSLWRSWLANATPQQNIFTHDSSKITGCLLKTGSAANFKKPDSGIEVTRAPKIAQDIRLDIIGPGHVTPRPMLTVAIPGQTPFGKAAKVVLKASKQF